MQNACCFQIGFAMFWYGVVVIVVFIRFCLGFLLANSCLNRIMGLDLRRSDGQRSHRRRHRRLISGVLIVLNCLKPTLNTRVVTTCLNTCLNYMFEQT